MKFGNVRLLKYSAGETLRTVNETFVGLTVVDVDVVLTVLLLSSGGAVVLSSSVVCW